MQNENGLGVRSSSAPDVLVGKNELEEEMDLPETPSEHQMDMQIARKTCKVCDEHINSDNTSEKGLLAELCNQCYQMEEDILEEL